MPLSALFLRRYHLVFMCVWALLLVPTLLLWRDSVAWVVFMSLYANFVGHFSSWQSARSEFAAEESPSETVDELEGTCVACGHTQKVTT